MQDIKKLIKKDKYVIGIKQTIINLHSKNVSCIFVADDSDEEFKQKIIQNCKEEVPFNYSLKKLELKEICNIDVPCGVVSFLKS